MVVVVVGCLCVFGVRGDDVCDVEGGLTDGMGVGWVK